MKLKLREEAQIHLAEHSCHRTTLVVSYTPSTLPRCVLIQSTCPLLCIMWPQGTSHGNRVKLETTYKNTEGHKVTAEQKEIGFHARLSELLYKEQSIGVALSLTGNSGYSQQQVTKCEERRGRDRAVQVTTLDDICTLHAIMSFTMHMRQCFPGSWEHSVFISGPVKEHGKTWVFVPNSIPWHTSILSQSPVLVFSITHFNPKKVLCCGSGILFSIFFYQKQLYFNSLHNLQTCRGKV